MFSTTDIQRRKALIGLAIAGLGFTGTAVASKAVEDVYDVSKPYIVSIAKSSATDVATFYDRVSGAEAMRRVATEALRVRSARLAKAEELRLAEMERKRLEDLKFADDKAKLDSIRVAALNAEEEARRQDARMKMRLLMQERREMRFGHLMF